MGKQGQVALKNYKPTAADPLCECGSAKHFHKADGRPANPEMDCSGFKVPESKNDTPDDAAPKRAKRRR